MFSFQTGELIIQKYDCRLPWMDIHQFDTKIPWCNTNETFHLLDDGFYDWNALMKSSKVKEICGQSPKCHRTMYDLQIENEPKKCKNCANIKIQLARPEVVTIEDFEAYDSQSLIGEVGGTFGMLLGFSFLTIFDATHFFLEKIQRTLQQFNLK